MIYLAADHRGYKLKEWLKDFLTRHDYEIEDVGAFALEKEDDYVDFGRIAVEKIAEDPMRHKGILICGSGHGIDIVANKFKGVRAALCFNKQVAVQSREHENGNVLVLAADWVRPRDAEEIVTAWLVTEFKGEERHVRRLQKITQIEEQNFR